MITNDKVVELRKKTGAGMMDCKNALVESNGDMEKAMDLIRKKGLQIASKKSSRAAKQGCIGSYIHMQGKIGVMVEVNCETDFVAKTEDFQNFVKDVCLQIVASCPSYVSREEVPAQVVEKEKQFFKDEVKGKPENVAEKIIQGKLDKFFKDICLLEQAFIKDDKKTIKDYITQVIAKTGENVVLKRFVRYQLGEE